MTGCTSLKCPFWDDGSRFSCAKAGFSCLQAISHPIGLTRINLTFVGDSLSIQHFNSFSCMLWARCGKHSEFTRSVADATQRCRSICGSQLCLQNAGTRYAGQHSTAYYLKLFENVSDYQVYNEGLWWNSIAAATEKFNAFLSVFSTLSDENKRRVIWRETSPQHFQSGRWSVWYKKEACRPLQSAMNPWKNTRLSALAQGCTFLEVWDLSATAWSDHLAQKTNHTRHRGMDCTHFCEPGLIDVWSNRLWYMLAAQDLHTPTR